MDSFVKVVAAVLADVVGVGLAVWLTPRLSERFEVFGFGNTVVLGGIFLLFFLSVYGIKKYGDGDKGSGGRWSFFFDRRVLGTLGVFFALALMLGTAYVSGFLDSVVTINRSMLDEPAVTIYLLLTPASWFGLALVYMLLLTTETAPAERGGAARVGLISLLALSGVNLMAVATTAIWQALWNRFEVPGDGVVVIAVIFVVNVLLYAPPRLIYALHGASWAGVLTLIPLLAYLSIVAVG